MIAGRPGGAMCSNGDGGVKVDGKEAVKWTQLAADKGSAEALYNLGMWYEVGTHNLTKDMTKAVMYLSASADTIKPNGFALIWDRSTYFSLCSLVFRVLFFRFALLVSVLISITSGCLIVV